MSPALLTVSLLVVGGILVLAGGQPELRRRWFVWICTATVLFSASHLPHGMLVLGAILAAVAGAELARLIAAPGVPRAAAWLATVTSFAAGVALPQSELIVAVCAGAALFPVLAARRGVPVVLLLPAALVGLPLAALAALPTALTIPAMMAVSVGDVGAWVGRSVMEIGMEDAEAATAWLEDPAFAGHGGESFAMLIERVGTWLAVRCQAKGTTIAVTHAAVLRAAAIAALGAEAAAFWRIEAAPLAMLSLGSDGRRWLMRELRQA